MIMKELINVSNMTGDLQYLLMVVPIIWVVSCKSMH
ncbi:hypothetical protein SAMN05660900_01235 [Megasphaera cerevisiae DSM 20462]|jgi:hypothetical protein|nr:hypothetical protein SAMN05660900_01235 [Megasphaera cerevisiae DSM 20462]